MLYSSSQGALASPFLSKNLTVRPSFTAKTESSSRYLESSSKICVVTDWKLSERTCKAVRMDAFAVVGVVSILQSSECEPVCMGGGEEVPAACQLGHRREPVHHVSKEIVHGYSASILTG